VGLGNPGKRYERTRHNLGFLVVDRFAAAHGLMVATLEFQSRTGRLKLNGEEVVLVKPQTYMNRCGAAVSEALDALRVDLHDLTVVHDDLDLPFGRIRIRARGGSGGHRGVRSLLETLPSELFFRVRIGIGRPSLGVEPADYVLQDFSPEEVSLLDHVVGRGADAVATLLRDGPHRAMEQFNPAE
jgi:PTH1 family peptidyl-tRNA hydrolase